MIGWTGCWTVEWVYLTCTHQYVRLVLSYCTAGGKTGRRGWIEVAHWGKQTFSDWTLPHIHSTGNWNHISTRKTNSLFLNLCSSFFMLKIINQNCIEFFSASNKAYQGTASALLSKELANANTQKAFDKNQQHSVWMMLKQLAVKTRIWCLEWTGKMDETQQQCKKFFWFLHRFQLSALTSCS